MSDLISRQDAIQGIREMASCADVGHDSESYVYMIQHLPSAEPKTGWIPVSERLPENRECVLISIEGDIEFGAYDRQNSDWSIWLDGYWEKGKCADAWMPLPEPYREDGEA